MKNRAWEARARLPMADAAKPMFKVAQRDGDWFWRVDMPKR
jgi:hypothetical protein